MDDGSRRDVRAVGRAASGPRPLGGLADLAELLGGDSDRSRRLLGGLAIGALAGAAVAGALLRARTVRGRGSRRP
jgi:hypothetical protein